MLRSAAKYLFHRHTIGCQAPRMCFRMMPQSEGRSQGMAEEENTSLHNHHVGQRISMREKIHVVIKTLIDLEDSKDAVYGTLDAWVAWEQNFPIASVKNVLLGLEREQQWHRVIQVIKWMLSKGQGNTIGTYQQLIRALDMDHRAEEAHSVWVKKIGNDLHSVPWQTCRLMIGVYYRNNMFDRLVKLFRDLEAYDRKPPEKSIVQRVADAYEMLGIVDEKERVLQKYADLLNKTRKESEKVKSDKKSKRVKSKRTNTSSGSRKSLANTKEA